MTSLRKARFGKEFTPVEAGVPYVCAPVRVAD